MFYASLMFESVNQIMGSWIINKNRCRLRRSRMIINTEKKHQPKANDRKIKHFRPFCPRARALHAYTRQYGTHIYCGWLWLCCYRILQLQMIRYIFLLCCYVKINFFENNSEKSMQIFVFFFSIRDIYQNRQKNIPRNRPISLSFFFCCCCHVFSKIYKIVRIQPIEWCHLFTFIAFCIDLMIFARIANTVPIVSIEFLVLFCRNKRRLDYLRPWKWRKTSRKQEMKRNKNRPMLSKWMNQCKPQ